MASTSRASLLLSVTLSELRVKALLMEDPPGDIIKTYLDRELSLIIQDTPEREKLINFYVQGEHTTGWDAIRTFLRQMHCFD